MLDLDQQFGKMIALQGDMATVSTLLISMAMKLQQRHKVLYIDCGNTFTPGFVNERLFRKTHPLYRPSSLRNIRIARPFSDTQLVALVKKLDRAVGETRSRVVCISCADHLFLVDRVDEKDALFLFSEVLHDLSALVKRHRVVVLLGVSALHSPKGAVLAKALESVIDIACAV